MVRLLLALGHAINAVPSMDKEMLILYLTLALFIGGVTMGYMAGLSH
jgi:hypothetical protein